MVGETKPSNLASLCRFHHRKVHEGAVTIQVLDDGALRFVKPNGESLDSIAPCHIDLGHSQPLGDWTELPAQHKQRHIHFDPNTGAGRWRGERMDYGLAVEVLLQKAERAKRLEKSVLE